MAKKPTLVDAAPQQPATGAAHSVPLTRAMEHACDKLAVLLPDAKRADLTAAALALAHFAADYTNAKNGA